MKRWLEVQTELARREGGFAAQRRLERVARAVRRYEYSKAFAVLVLLGLAAYVVFKLV